MVHTQQSTLFVFFPFLLILYSLWYLTYLFYLLQSHSTQVHVALRNNPLTHYFTSTDHPYKVVLTSSEIPFTEIPLLQAVAYSYFLKLPSNPAASVIVISRWL